jgi:two-component system chemotaxis response regulator CheY
MNPALPVLVVDDSEATATIVVSLLQRLGFRTVDKVSNGAAALAALRSRYHQFVIVDLNMPAMDGSALLNMIRQDDFLAKTRVILMSAQRDKGLVQAGAKCNADGIIMKPFTSLALKQKLQDLNLIGSGLLAAQPTNDVFAVSDRFHFVD